MKMLILVITAFDEYLTQSPKNDNISRKNSKNQAPSHHHYLLNAYCVPRAALGALLTLSQ